MPDNVAFHLIRCILEAGSCVSTECMNDDTSPHRINEAGLVDHEQGRLQSLLYVNHLFRVTNTVVQGQGRQALA